MLVHHSLSVLLFVALAYSGPLIGRNPQCNVQSMHCCNSMQSSDSSLVTGLIGALGGLLPPLQGNTQVGIACSPLTGAGSVAECGANPVCCTNTSFNGLINVGCSPLNL